jgi:hypothetical protein
MTFEDVVQYYGCEPLKIPDIERYLDQGNDIDYQDPRPGPGYPRQGWTLLHYAAAEGQVDVLKYLARRGANLNATDSSGWSALHLAVDLDFVVATQDGHLPTELPTTEVLLRLGADDSIADKKGRTARDLLGRFHEVALVYDRAKARAIQSRE